MNQNSLPVWFPWALAAGLLLVLALLVCGLAIAWLLRRRSGTPSLTASAPAAASVADEQVPESPAPSDRAWSRWFGRQRPCLVVTGEPGSGASSLAAQWSGRASEAEPERLAWRSLDETLLLDVPGSAFAGSATERWDAVLGKLIRRRPARPVDAIILTVAAPQLSGASAEDLARRGRLIRTQLERLRIRLGFQLPVYVVVTQCDHLPHFADFTGALPAARADGLLGWSVPHRLETSYSDDWCEEAIAAICGELEDGQLALVANSSQPVPGGLLRFPASLRALRDPLRAWLAPVFRSASAADAHLFRGLYFSGTREAGDPPGLLFVADLLTRKVLPEVRLAHPASAGFRPRRRMVAAAQATAAALSITLAAGLWWSHEHLGTLRDRRLEPLLNGLSRSLAGEAQERTAGVERAFDFLATVETLDVQGFRSVFLPASWADPVDSRVERILGPAFQELVAEACRRALEQRIARLAQAPAALGTTPATSLAERYEVSPAYRALAEYLDSIAELDQNLNRYERLQTRQANSLSEVNHLIEYLSGRRFGADKRFESNRYYRMALLDAHWDPVAGRERFTESAARRTRQLAVQFLETWIGQSALGAALGDLSARLDEFDRAEGQSNEALEDLEQSILALKAALDSGAWDWALGEFNRRRFGDLGGKLEQMPFVAPEMLDELDAEGEHQQLRLTGLLEEAAEDSAGAVLDLTGDKVRLSDPIRSFGAALTRLRSFAPAAVSETNAWPTNAPAGYLWDAAGLHEVISQAASYKSFFAETLPSLAPRFRGPLKRLAASRARSAAAHNLIEARKPNPAPYRTGAAPERTLLAEIRNLSEASALYREVAAALDAMNAQPEREQLRRLLSTQAVDLLTQVTLEWTRAGAYAAKVSVWDGEQPLTAALFDADTPQKLRRFLDAERGRMTSLSGDYAEPLLAALEQLGEPSKAKPVLFWRQMREALAGYAGAKPGNPLQALESWLSADLDKVTPEGRCQATPMAAGDTFFAERSRALLEQVVAACQAALAGKYRELADRFNQRLAGRYPFTDLPEPAEQPIAEAADVAAFFSLASRFGRALEAALAETRFGASGRHAGAFLSQMAALRPLLTPLPGEALPSADLSVEFRARRSEESGANQIIDWSLQVGDQIVTADSKTPGRWRFGQPIVLTLRYARNSPWLPAAGPGLSVDGRTVRFEYRSPWALAELVRLHAVETTTSSAAAQGLLRFRIPNQAAAGDAMPAPTVLYFRLKLASPEPQAARRARFATGFPTEAPALSLPTEASWKQP